MSYTIQSAKYANAEHTAAVVVTQEAGAVLVSAADTAAQWADMLAWGTPADFLDVAALRQQLCAKVSEIRYAREIAGTDWGNQPVWTDRDSRSTLTGLVLAAQLGVRIDGAIYKFPDGAKPLANADLVPMASAILTYVQDCYDREAELVAALEGATTVAALQAIDLTAGWPT